MTTETPTEKRIIVSPRRLAANRCNAQKSTGPRTPRGKAVASRNARKHGLLAQSVVVRGYQLRESPRAFSKLCREFHAQLTPIGPLEETLVDLIAAAAWRLRRARKAEAGEIELNVDSGWWRRKNENALHLLLEKALVEGAAGSITRLESSSKGCNYVLGCFRNVRQCVERDGELTKAAVAEFNIALKGTAYGLVGKMNQFRAWLVENPENLDPKILRARHRDEVLKFLNREIERLGQLILQREEREEIEEQSRQSAAVLPSPEVLDKTLRYEASLNRQLYQALNQLERLQRRRQGEPVPPPLAVDVSARPQP